MICDVEVCKKYVRCMKEKWVWRRREDREVDVRWNRGKRKRVTIGMWKGVTEEVNQGKIRIWCWEGGADKSMRW